MAEKEYIERVSLIKFAMNYIPNIHGDTTMKVVKRALKAAPAAADVAQKSEVAREIFAEIEREIVAALQSNYSAKQERVEKQIPDDFVSYMCEGKIAALRGIDDFIAELKKKYTEGET